MANHDELLAVARILTHGKNGPLVDLVKALCAALQEETEK